MSLACAAPAASQGLEVNPSRCERQRDGGHSWFSHCPVCCPAPVQCSDWAEFISQQPKTHHSVSAVRALCANPTPVTPSIGNWHTDRGSSSLFPVRDNPGAQQAWGEPGSAAAAGLDPTPKSLPVSRDISGVRDEQRRAHSEELGLVRGKVELLLQQGPYSLNTP